jgi:hypothetical protein
MEDKELYAELSSIRSLMERSTKFISLSGLSGVLAGLYALVGAYLAYQLAPATTEAQGRGFNGLSLEAVAPILGIALMVLLLSLTTGILLTIRQAKKEGKNYWNPVSRKLLANMAVPLITGGIFILILVYRGEFDTIVSLCLIFYGLALVAASQFTFSDVKWLGLLEVALGLSAALLPQFSLLFWVLGFGVLHVLYGTIMHFKYKQ